MKTTARRILVTGAEGQLGQELCEALRWKHGIEQVIATDLHIGAPGEISIVRRLDVLDKAALYDLVQREKVTEVYHLAATLSATGEKYPLKAWDLNMGGLLNVLDVAKVYRLKVFWPSSIAVFGSHSPKAVCPQHTVTQPATAYGISKLAGEGWCQYYYEQYGVDVRSIRYPGLIGYKSLPGGGTTDYAVDIFHQAVAHRHYTCYLKPHTALPMLYMPDAIRAAIELMEAPESCLSIRSSYNLSGMTFTPQELAAAIQQHLPGLQVTYRPDERQSIAEQWPGSMDDRFARHEWHWQSKYGLQEMVSDMLLHLKGQPAHRRREWNIAH